MGVWDTAGSWGLLLGAVGAGAFAIPIIHELIRPNWAVAIEAKEDFGGSMSVTIKSLPICSPDTPLFFLWVEYSDLFHGFCCHGSPYWPVACLTDGTTANLLFQDERTQMTREDMLDRMAEHRQVLRALERPLRYDVDEEADNLIQKPELAKVSMFLLVATKAADVAGRFFLKVLSLADQQHRSHDGNHET